VVGAYAARHWPVRTERLESKLEPVVVARTEPDTENKDENRGSSLLRPTGPKA